MGGLDEIDRETQQEAVQSFEQQIGLIDLPPGHVLVLVGLQLRKSNFQKKVKKGRSQRHK